MSTVEGVDYSTDKPDPVGLARVGKRFAMRYGGPGGAAKHLTRAEVDALTRAGIAIVALAEGTANGLLGGASVGREWAESARRHFAALGMPEGRPIYFAVDFDVTAAQWPQVRAALAAAGQVLGPGRVGVYGGVRAVQWAARDQVAAWFFQTYAWSAGRWSDLAHVRQYRNGVSLVGGTVDLDTAMVSDYGQWTVGGQPPHTNGDDVTPEESKQLADVAYTLGHAYDPNGDPAEPFHVWTARVNGALAGIDQKLVDLGEAAPGDPAGGVDIAALLVEVRDALNTVAETPLIDPVAVAAAIANRPEIARTLAEAVAAQLAAITGEITMSGTLTGGIKPPVE